MFRRECLLNAHSSQSLGKATMSAEPPHTPDFIGLTKVAPFSRRGFMTASAAVTAGYTLAAGPVRADVIKTDTDGLMAGDTRIKVACLLYTSPSPRDRQKPRMPSTA